MSMSSLNWELEEMSILLDFLTQGLPVLPWLAWNLRQLSQLCLLSAGIRGIYFHSWFCYFPKHFFKICLLISNVYEHFVYMYVYALPRVSLVSAEKSIRFIKKVRKRYLIHCGVTDGCVLGTKPSSSGRAASALNCWAISTALPPSLFFRQGLSAMYPLLPWNFLCRPKTHLPLLLSAVMGHHTQLWGTSSKLWHL